MKRVTLFVAMLAVLVFANGCAMIGMSSKTGAALIKMDKEGGMATGHPDTSKSGKACAQNILGLIAMGDASVEKAMEDGGIKQVATVDYSYMVILNFYGEVCTLVTGS